MMRQTETVFLETGDTREPYSADLIHGATVAELQAADAQWQPFLAQAVADALARGVPRFDLPDNKHWEWERKARAMRAGSVAFAIRADGDTQALMIMRTDKVCRLSEQFAEPMVYVDYLATAPWNLPRLMTPRYTKGGLRMIQAAVRYSVSLGLDGRIGLHSLRGAEGFYRDRLTMRELGADPLYEDLRYFEATSTEAAQIVK